MKSRISVTFAGLLAAITLSSCAQLPETELLVDGAVVGAMAPLDSGGFVYGEWLTGNIFEVDDADNEDEVTKEQIGRVDISLGSARGLLGITTKGDRIFVAYTSSANVLTVVELLDGEQRTVWQGPEATGVNLGGRLTTSPLGRLVLSIGDFAMADIASDPDSPIGKIVSLDPDRGTDQSPNVLSAGWTDPRGLTYDRGGNLWVADGDRAGRAGPEGFIGDVAQLGTAVGVSGLSTYGDQEMLVCQRNNKELKRYLVVDGVRLVPGRTVAENCAYDVIEQANGLISYATDTTIRAS